MLLILRYQALVDYWLKKSIIHKSMVLRRKMKMLENHNKKVKDDLKKDSKCY